MLASHYPGKFRSLDWQGPKPPTKTEKRALFNRYAQAVADNLKAGEVGHVLDFDGGLYEINKERRSARRLAENEGLDVRQAFQAAQL